MTQIKAIVTFDIPDDKPMHEILDSDFFLEEPELKFLNEVADKTYPELTPEQQEQVRDWLFKDKMSYELAGDDYDYKIINPSLNAVNCPKCRTQNITAEPPNGDHNQMWEHIYCNDCSYGWINIFEFTGQETNHG